MKKLVCILLAAAMLLCVAPLSGFTAVDWPEIDFGGLFTPRAEAAEIVASGNCGAYNDGYDESTGEWHEDYYDDVTYTLDSDGVLTVRGSGRMADWGYEERPWYNNRSSVKTVVIETGVTSIGNYAFAYCSGLTSVTIPDGVTSIGDCAFRECTSLTGVTIPDSVTSIGSNAFSNCNILHILCSQNSTAHQYAETNGIAYGLTDVPASEQTISGTVGKTQWSLDKRNCILTVSSEGAMQSFSEQDAPWIQYKKYIHSVVIREKTSADSAKNTTSVSVNAFKGCGALASVSIPSTVTSIGGAAFMNCYALENINIPDSVKSIGDQAFYMEDDYNNRSRLAEVHIGSGVTIIGKEAFYGCSALKSVTIPDNVKSAGEAAFANCRSLETVSIGTGLSVISDYMFQSCSSLPAVTIPENITSIGSAAFWHCRSLTNVTIPDSVTSIGAGTFRDCTGLTNVTIPDNVIDINAMFFECTNLGSVAIGKNVYIINGNAFAYCESLPVVVLPESVSLVSGGAFSNCTALEKLYALNNSCSFVAGSVPANATICGYAGSEAQTFAETNGYDFTAIVAHGTFGAEGDNLTWVLDADGDLVISGAGNMNGNANFTPGWAPYKSSIKKVVIEPTVTSIAPNAFSGCTELIRAEISSNVTTIGANAFSGCSKLSLAPLPASLLTIGASAFNGCSALPAVTLPESLIVIGTHAFYGCAKLTAVAVPAAVTALGDGAFAACTALTNLTVDENNEVYESAGNCVIRKADGTLVAGCKKSVIPADGSVTAIGAEAFRGMTGLKSVTIPYGVTAIGDYAFSACTGLTAVALPATVSTVGQYAFNKCMGMTSLSLPEGLTAIGDYAFYSCTRLPSVTLPKTLNSIGQYAFSNCKGLTDLTILPGVTAIGNYAFSVCTGLTSVTLPGTVTGMGQYVFYNCTGLTAVTLRKGLTSTGAYTFSGCAQLTQVNLPESLTTIGKYAFNGCTGLTQIALPKNLTTIGTYAFNGCTGLTQIALPKNLTTIGTYAFNGCTGLTQIALPKNLTTIGTYAFKGCTGLNKIVFPHGITSVGASAFSGCTAIGYVGYVGTEEDWAKVTVASGNAPITGAEIHFLRDLSLYCTVTISLESIPYSGSAIYPEISVTDGETVLEEGTDYIVAYDDCIDVGVHTVTVSGTGDYFCDVEKSFTITGEKLTADRVTLSPATAVYKGQVYDPVLTVKNAAGKTLTEGEDYTVTVPSGRKKPGTYTYTVKGINYYLATVKKTFTIEKQPLDAARVTLSATSFVYNGAVQQPTVTVKSAQGNTMTPGASYTVSYSSGCKKPGTYTVTVTGEGNFTGVVKKTFTIEKQPLNTARVTLSTSSFIYNGAVQQPTVTVKSAQGNKMTAGASYTVSYSSGCQRPGTYTVTVTGQGNFKGTVKKTFTIEKQPVDAARVTLSADSLVYNGEDQHPQVTVTSLQGGVMTQGSSYTVAYPTSSKRPGEYTLTVTGAGYYTGSVEMTYQITPQPLDEARVTLSQSVFVANGTAQKPTVTVTNAKGGVMTKGSSYTVSYSAGCKKTGIYTVTVTGIGYYTGTVTMPFSIVDSNVLTAEDVSFTPDSAVYNGKAHDPAVTVKNDAGLVLTEGKDYTVTKPAGRKYAGKYKYTITGIGEYAGTAQKSFTVAPQPLSAENVILSAADPDANGSMGRIAITVKNEAGSVLTNGNSYTYFYTLTEDGTLLLTVTGKSSYTGTVTKEVLL